uniref:Reverse transcriptase domain-containing protein n=1 Tax=Latimeria chalumnae TaxID=7897 RepID=H3ACT8_LATCH
VTNKVKKKKKKNSVNYLFSRSNTVQEELEKALQSVKPRKAPGPDNPHGEFLVHMGRKCKSWLLDFFNMCIARCRLPKVWQKATVVALLKLGKPANDPKSYRPISLISIVYKLLERLLLNHLAPIIEPQLPNYQAGFCPSHCTEDQVICLTNFTEEETEAKKKVGAVFIDLSS